LGTRVLPAFRPDAALAANRPEFFTAWLGRLEDASGTAIGSLPALLEALRKRCEFFHERGCRISDHGLDRCYAERCSDSQASAIFDLALSGKPASPEDHAKYASFVMLFLGRLYAEKGWTMQLHLGALRNCNTRLLRHLGPDTGFDSIGDFQQAQALGAFLDRLDTENALPKTILYNLNPADNYAFATMAGNYQDGTVPGKVQFGSGWWFLDQKEAMEWQLNALSNLGLLSRFVGMVTDSRSFMSYPRHEYFRRVLCNLIGRDIEAGELPDDDALIGPLVRNICHENARQYLRLQP
jgi:glucuronate isomerase